MLRSVASAFPSYAMGFVAFPHQLCLKVDRGFKNFWWGFHLEKSQNLTMKSWGSICVPKSMGGLGIRSMGLNKALISKLVWKVFTNEDCLWVRMLRSKYLHHVSFSEAVGDPKASWFGKASLNGNLCWIWAYVLLLGMREILMCGRILGSPLYRGLNLSLIWMWTNRR